MLDFLGTMLGFIVALAVFGLMLAVAVFGFFKSERAVKNSASSSHAPVRTSQTPSTTSSAPLR